MTDKNIVHTTEYYYVVQMVEPKNFEDGSPPLNYMIICSETEAVEAFASFYPAAIETANGLSDRLAGHLKKEEPSEENVVELLR